MFQRLGDKVRTPLGVHLQPHLRHQGSPISKSIGGWSNAELPTHLVLAACAREKHDFSHHRGPLTTTNPAHCSELNDPDLKAAGLPHALPLCPLGGLKEYIMAASLLELGM